METVGKRVIYFCLAAGLFLLLTACSGSAPIGEPPPASVCRYIVNTKCVNCHYKTRICGALGTKSVSNWERTIKYMLKQGAQLTEDEQNKVVACLSSLPKGSPVVCD